MTMVMKIASLLILMVVVGATVAEPVEAQRRWRRSRSSRPARTVSNAPTAVRPAWRWSNSYGALQSDFLRYDHPRYTGAFHDRYFDEMRYTSGDRPIRGTAW